MDYRQTSGTAQSWRRAYQIHVNNFFGQQPNILFQEEDVVSMGDKTFNQPSMTSVSLPFAMGTEIPLLNPLTGEPLGTSAKHEDLQVLLYSLYVQLAQARDSQVEGADEASRQAKEALQRAADALAATQVAPEPQEAT